jgi:hypothetical protein
MAKHKLRHGAKDINEQCQRDAEMYEVSKIDRRTYHSPIRAAARAALRARWAEDDALKVADQNAKAEYAAAQLSIMTPAEVRALDDGKTIEGE